MADIRETLRQVAIQIRDEHKLGANTAKRIGAFLLSLVDSGVYNEELEELFLSKTKPDKAAEIIDFLKGLTIDGDKASIDADGVATVQQLIALLKAKVANLEVTNTATAKNVTVSEKVTTLNLLVQKLAETYDLDVSNVATLFRTIVKDYVSSETFIAGFAGEGFKLYKALSGDWNLEVDNVTVRKAMTIFELIISKIRSVNGGLVVSQGNGRVKSVNETTGSPTYYVLGIEGDMTFLADDFVRCQVFSSTGAKYYWVRVDSVSSDSIIIPKSEFPEGTVPAVGDDLVQMGNKTNKSRQGVLYLTASEDGKPRFSVLDGVNSTDLTGKNKLILGCLDGITDSDFPSDAQPSGYGLWAANVFLKGLFILRNGKSVEDELNDQITAVKTAFEIREGQISTKVQAATTAAAQAAGSASAAATSESNAAGSASQASGILASVTQKETNINQTANAIELKATRAETAAGRAESAEASINVKADGIVLQASNKAAQKAVDGVQVGGRNLILNSNKTLETSSNTGIYWDYFYLAEVLVAGQTYILSCDEYYKTGAGNIFLSNGAVNPGIVQTAVFNEPFIAQNTISSIALTNQGINGSVARLTRPKLEEGNKTTTWTPAFEDIDASIALRPTAEYLKSQFTITPGGISLIGKTLSLAGMVTFSSLDSSAQSTINGKATKTEAQGYANAAASAIQVGSRNLIRMSLLSNNGAGYTTHCYKVTKDSLNRMYLSTGVIKEVGYYSVSYRLKIENCASSITLVPNINDHGVASYASGNTGGWILAKGTVYVTNYIGQYGFIDWEFGGVDANVYISDIVVVKGTKPLESYIDAPEDVSADATSKANTAKENLATSLGYSSYSAMAAQASVSNTIIDGNKIRTSLIDADAVVTSTLLASKIAATDITTGRLTVTTGAKIGNWSISNGGIVSNQANGTLEVYHNGGRFLKINDTSSTTLMSVRADGGTGISIYTQDTTGKCITMTAQTGGMAMECYGSVTMHARTANPIFELIDLIGPVRVGGMSINAIRSSGTIYLDNDNCWLTCTGTSTVYLPFAPYTGKVIYICRGAHVAVTVHDNMHLMCRKGTSYIDTLDIDTDGEIWIFQFDGSYWMIGRLST